MNSALKLIEEKIGKKLTLVGEVYRGLIDHFPLRPIENDEDNDLAVYILTELIDLSNDEVFKENDQKQVDDYMKSLGILVQNYEKSRYPRAKVSGRDMLKFMMELHGLKQSDLSNELGGQSIVSSILNGKRKLNKNQIQKLAKRFHVPADVFFDQE